MYDTCMHICVCVNMYTFRIVYVYDVYMHICTYVYMYICTYVYVWSNHHKMPDSQRRGDL